MMNILLTCAGRRNYLVGFFQEALKGRGKVFAGDASAQAPALQEADQAFVLPPVSHADYVDILLDICRHNHVRLLISLNDLELPLLAKHAQRFRHVGTLPVISSVPIVDLCFDKWATFQFLKSCDLAVPHTYLSLEEAHTALEREELSFPLVVKPRWGTASIGIEYPEDEDELELTYRLIKMRVRRTILADISKSDPERCVIIQERLVGQEYGIDVINDLEGRHTCTLARRKLLMRAGETDRAITVHDEQIERLGATIGRQLRHIGNLDCDVFATDNGYYILEMNPRFGGGYPFSHISGANLPALLIAWANNEAFDTLNLKSKPDITAAKCDRLVVMKTTK